MSSLTHSTSPDPLTLPSSPLGARSTNQPAKQRRSTRNTAQPKSPAPRSRANANTSPSKSLIMDIPAEAGVIAGTTGSGKGESPWRIKVTVQAEPREMGGPRSSGGSASPAKEAGVRARTVKVPLKGVGEEGSPVKRVGRKSRVGESEGDAGTGDEGQGVKRRKGTPVRRRKTRQRGSLVATERDDGDEDVGGALGDEVVGQLDSDAKHSLRRSRAQDTTITHPTERSRRLTQAREELDVALKEAVASPRAISSKPLQHTRDAEENEENIDPMQQNIHSNGEAHDYAPGDMTVAHDEDFTMVSIETLQSMKQNTSQLLENSGLEIGEKSAVSVSYMPSSPPSRYERHSDHRLSGKGEVRYPDLSSARLSTAASRQDAHVSPLHQVAIATAGIENAEYMTTIPSVTSTAPEDISETSAQPAHAEEAEDDDIWAEEASRSLEESQPQSHFPSRKAAQRQQRVPHPTATEGAPVPQSAQVDSNVFAPVNVEVPPRAKIPRSWRRGGGGGEGLSYVDSPAYGLQRQTSGTSADGEGVEEGAGGGSRRGSGVLTPPSTDDDGDEDKEEETGGENANFEEVEDEDANEAQEGDTDITHPDAAGTQLQLQLPSHTQTQPHGHTHNEVRSPSSDSSSASSIASPGSGSEESDDTGMFWQTHLPNVYRSQRQQRQRIQRPRFQRQKKAMDLSELLGLGRSPAKDEGTSQRARDDDAGDAGGSRVEAGDGARSATRSPPRKIVRVARGVVPAPVARASEREKVVSSPLRKSLLRSSKIGGSLLLGSGGDRAEKMGSVTYLRREQRVAEEDFADGAREESTTSVMESFESKASDQRQLLAEMEMAGPEQETLSAPQDEEIDATLTGFESSSAQGGYDNEDPSDTTSYAYDDEDISDHTSYVHNQNESDHYQEGPMRSYEENLNLESPQKIKVKFNDSSVGDSFSLTPKKEYPPLFGPSTKAASSTPKISTHTPAQSITLGSKKPAAQPLSEPQPSLFTRLSTTFWSAVIRPSGPASTLPPPDPEYPPLLRHGIRNRYGVLSNQHPWTMAHMRTLHRLLNSSTSGRVDSIVPKSGPLPAALSAFIGKKLQTVDNDYTFTFTTQHAHIVDAFMATLVPPHITQAIAAGEMEFLGDEEARKHRGWTGDRHGDWITFEGMDEVREPGDGSAIERGWVVRLVGNCLRANVWTKERLEQEEAERKRIREERLEWERRNGFRYGDFDDGEESEGETKGLQEARILPVA